MKAEEAHHPLKGCGKAGRLIGDDLTIRQSKFQWNRLVGLRNPFSVERAQHPPRLMVATENNRGRLECIGPKSVKPLGMIKQGDVVALLTKVVRSGETGQTCAKNKNSLGGRSGHKNRERSQVRRAIITR